MLNSFRLLPSVSLYQAFLIVELMVIGLIITPWSANMPSGAAWRPGVPLMMVSLFLLPPLFAVFVNIPALIFITARSRRPWWKYCETIAHVALGLYLGGATYWTVLERLQGHYFTQMFSVLVALLVHLIVNRLVSAVIVAHREGRSLWLQILLMWRELHWGYFSAYLLILLTSMVSPNDASISILIAALILFFLFGAVSNNSRILVLQTSVQTDGLTSLENRTAWEALLNESQARDITCGIRIYMIDIDDFKDINDRFGHLVGDETLRRMAKVLKNAAPSQARIFRIGGDEFVIYLPPSVSAASIDLEPRIREQVVKEFTDFDELEGAMNLSIGSASAPEDGQSLIDLLEVSDHRMYEHKRQTRFTQSGPDLAVSATILSLVLAIEARDAYTSGHSLRVAFYAWKLADYMQLPIALLQPIFRAALVHDVGKIGALDDTPNEPDPFSNQDGSPTQQHPEMGYRMCRRLGLSTDELDVIRYHHARWDGQGCPYGLAGEDIPLLARITAVVDVYDALTSTRGDRLAWSHQDAMDFLAEGRNTQFDPSCVDAWIDLNELEVQSEQYREWATRTGILSKEGLHAM